jgi:c-di-GMP-binding flagellar brake protein YcgR
MSTKYADIQRFTFHIWERLHIEIGEERKKGIYTCRIEDIGDDYLIVNRPEFKSGQSLLADNRIVHVNCARDDAAYTFSARIAEMRPKSSTSMYLKDLSRISRLQRRRFVRLDICLMLKYKILSRPIHRPIVLTTHDLVESHSINFSAGGLLITVEKPIRVDDALVLLINVGKYRHLPRWMIAACRHTRTLEGGRTTAGVEFILEEDIPRYFKDSEMKYLPESLKLFDDKMQNRLVGELFAEQLLMRQKGIL